MKGVFSWVCVAVLLGAAACGGDDSTAADGGGGDGGGSVDSGDRDGGGGDRDGGGGDSDGGGGDSDGGGGGSDGGGSDADGGMATDGGGDVDGGSGTDAGSSAVAISRGDVAAWANCMPIVSPDPMRFFITLTYDNTAGASEAVVTFGTATFTLDDAAASTTSVDFDVETLTVAGGASATQRHAKTTSSPVLSSCSLCSDTRTLAYDIAIDVDGATQHVTGTTSFGCVY